MKHRILVVDDDKAFRLSTAALLESDGYEVEAVGDAQTAATAIKAGRFDLMLLDLRMPGTDGITLVEALRVWGEGVAVLMISGYGTVDAAVRALHAGADDFLTKPVEPDVLSTRVRDLLERRPSAKAAAPSAHGLVGRSPAMRGVFTALHQVAPTEATVLISGETGTGKELVAAAVHEFSPRRAKPFLAVNCGALATGLLESELFGHLRGAFTGALRDKPGLFEAADGGTMFLDEIGEVPPELQLRLLRVLQEREVTRVGDVRARKINVRVVAATNRDLRAMVKDGSFREDLFYRLHVFPIHVPALRDRASDIPLLVTTRLTTPNAISPLAMKLLREYAWPGNVRELFAAIESASIRAGGARIDAQHLPEEVRTAAAGEGMDTKARYRAVDDTAEEREAIRAALELTDGAVTRAAELLGMGRTTLWRKMRSLGLERG